VGDQVNYGTTYQVLLAQVDELIRSQGNKEKDRLAQASSGSVLHKSSSVRSSETVERAEVLTQGCKRETSNQV